MNANELADEWRNKDLKVWHREHYQDWGDKAEFMLRTIPELLEALETLIYLDERNELTSYQWVTTMASAKKLVAKAKGEQA